MRSIDQEERPDGWWDTYRVLVPPRPVWLHMARAMPPRRLRHGDVPLRVRACGVDVSQTRPAQLVAWQQTSVGDWWGEVHTELTNTRGMSRPAVLYVPAEAISPRDEQ